MSWKAKRKSGQHLKSTNTTSRWHKLPPDPEQENQMRAARANVAIVAFRAFCAVDKEDAVSDLLTDLMHLCDRDPALGGFRNSLDRAYRFYKEETASDAEYVRMLRTRC